MQFLVLLEDWEHVERRVLEKIDVAGLKCVHGGLRVRHRHPLDTIDFHDLAAGGPARRLLSRNVVGVLDVNSLHARLEFFLHELERSGADLLGNGLVGRSFRNALRHHEWHQRRRLADRVKHETVRLLQLQNDGLGIGRCQAVREFHELLAHTVFLAPALQ